MKRSTRTIWIIGILAAAFFSGVARAAGPVSLAQLISSGGSLTSAGKKFADFRFSGNISQVDPANVMVETIESPGCILGLRFSGGMVANGAEVDFALGYTVETTTGLPIISQIGQSFLLSASGSGGFILIGETVFDQGFLTGNAVAQSSIGFADFIDPPGEDVNGDRLIINPPLNKVWVTKDIMLHPYNAQASVGLTKVDQTFCPNTTPSITCPAGFSIQCLPAPAPDFTGGTVSDNCGPVTSSDGSLVGGPCGGTITRTWTATDACGRVATCTQIITVNDTIPPTFTGCPAAAIDLGCNPTPPTCVEALALVTASDNCAGSLTPSCSAGMVQVNGCLRSQTFTLKATDGCNNSMTCPITYTWKVDTTPPVFTGCPSAPIDLGCNPTPPDCAKALALVTVSDDCDGALTPSCSAGMVQVNECLRSQTFTLTATDGCMHSVTCPVTYTWKVDTTPPVFTGCPSAPIDLGCNPTPPSCADALALVTVSDGCDGPVTPTCDAGIVQVNNCSRSQTFTLTATDGCMHSVTCPVTYVWKVDITPPILTACPADIVVDIPFADPCEAGVSVPFTPPTAMDTCGPAAVVCRTNGVVVTSPTIFFSSSPTLVICTATDGCGNPASCSFTVNVTCQSPPLASIGDFVFCDLNGNGKQDGGAEIGISGVTVKLYTCADIFVASTTTDANGLYLFTVPAGAYYVEFSNLPVDFVFSPKNAAGTTMANDSDADTTTGRTVCTTLTPGENDLTWDAGLIKPCPPGFFTVQKAVGDPAYGGSTEHALWLPGIGTDFDFIPTPGSFIENPNGTAQLTGTVQSQSNANKKFAVTVTLSGFTSAPPPASPKKQLDDNAYSEDGGPVVTASWHYYTTLVGSLTGLGDFLGATMNITRTGPAFQVGIGANGKNINFGASSWFTWTVTHQPNNGTMTASGQGDFNLDLGSPCASGAIGDFVWNDLDSDGRQDAGEPGLPNVTVKLMTCGGAVLATTNTDVNGSYLFTGLPPGVYKIMFSLPSGAVFSPANATSDAVDSDAASGTGITACFALNAAETNLTVDAGVRTIPPAAQGCTLTIGYYKNHSSAITPLPIYLGTSGGAKTFTVSSQSIGVNVLGQHTYGAPANGITKLCAQLLAAKLNILHGATPSVVTTTISSADAFLATHNYLDWASLTATEQSSVLTWHSALDNYNNGVSGPGHCGDKETDRCLVATATPCPNQVKLCWKASHEASSYTVARSVTPNGPYTTIKSGLTSTNYIDNAVVNGTAYYYLISAVKSGVEKTDSDEVYTIPTANLPSPWSSKDIGSVVAGGGANYNGTFTVSGSGTDIGSTADAFRYVYQQGDGDCTIVAKVLSVQNTHAEAKAGVMIRETLAANSTYAGIFLTPGAGVAFQSRSATGGMTSKKNIAGIKAPYWVKIVRKGSTFTAYYSSNGNNNNWTSMGSVTVTMGSSVNIGLGVTSRKDGYLSTATFNNVTATP